MKEKIECMFTSPTGLAKALGVSRATVVKWINSGKLPAFRFGNQWRIEHSAVVDFMERAASQREGTAA